MKNLASILLLALLFGTTTSCKKETPSDPNYSKDQIIGKWRGIQHTYQMHLYTSTTDDILNENTTDWSSYEFEFKPDGTLVDPAAIYWNSATWKLTNNKLEIISTIADRPDTSSYTIELLSNTELHFYERTEFRFPEGENLKGYVLDIISLSKL